MTAIVVRECIVLFVGVVVSCAVSLAAGAAGGVGVLAAAIFTPIVFCLVRAAMVRYPARHFSSARRIAWQLLVAVALVSLLLFEVGVGMFAGAAGIPLAFWFVVTALGAVYVALFCAAHRLEA